VNGFDYQTTQLIRIHNKKYPIAPDARAPAPVSSLSRNTHSALIPTGSGFRFAASSSQGRTSGSQSDHDGGDSDLHRDAHYNLDGYNSQGNEGDYDMDGGRPQYEERGQQSDDSMGEDEVRFERVRANLGGAVTRQSHPDSDSETEDSADIIPRAFGETSAVRLAYLQAVQGNVYDGITVKAADNMLNHSLNMLSAAGALPKIPKPVCTVKSARRRLGLDPDQYITQNPICTVCWKIYTLEAIKSMSNPRCTVLRCKGTVYHDKMDADGNTKRVPAKILPTVSLIQELRKMFMRPGFAASLRDSRQEPVDPNDDPEFPMEDVHHGSMWHS
jgi:hypothetical protein